jgi:SAM-dependent methyltransferase
MDELAQGRSFGTAAELYDRIRPGYPVEAITWILGDRPVRVVDLGAGTGILTRQIAALGHDVTPVEPDDRMRPAGGLAGTAEAIPLPDSSVDVIIAGQAYHWFDPARAMPEIARVLRPGGRFGALWNDRDKAVPWVARLSEIKGERGRVVEVAPHPLFGPVERETFGQAVPHTPDSLVDLMSSRSYFITATPARQAEIEAAIRELCATHPDLAGRDEFALPYVTRAYRMAAR